MSEIILYLRARGCTLFGLLVSIAWTRTKLIVLWMAAKHLLSSARFKYLVNHALEQLFPQISLLKRRRELQQRTGLASAHPANPTLSRITPLFLDLLLLSSIRADVGWFEEEVKTWKDGPGELAWLAAEEARQSFDRFGTKGLAWVWTRVPVV